MIHMYVCMQGRRSGFKRGGKGDQFIYTYMYIIYIYILCHNIYIYISIHIIMSYIYINVCMYIYIDVYS